MRNPSLKSLKGVDSLLRQDFSWGRLQMLEVSLQRILKAHQVFLPFFDLIQAYGFKTHEDERNWTGHRTYISKSTIKGEESRYGTKVLFVISLSLSLPVCQSGRHLKFDLLLQSSAIISSIWKKPIEPTGIPGLFDGQGCTNRSPSPLVVRFGSSCSHRTGCVPSWSKD